MSADYQGKSDQQIIQEASDDLNSRRYQDKSSSGSAISQDSGVTDATLDRFPSLAGQPQVQTGRGGQTGGGTNDQFLPPEEGGAGRDGSSSGGFEGEGKFGGPEDRIAEQLRRDPGGTSIYPDDVKSSTVRGEAIPSNTRPSDGQPQGLLDENANPYDPSA